MTTKSLEAALKQKPFRHILHAIIEAIQDANGKNLSLIDVSKMFNLSDFFVIASGRSDRQVQGITNRVLDAIQKTGAEVASVEGLEEGQWVLVDLGDIVVHIFYEATREYYDFDSLWARAEHIKIPLGRELKSSRYAA